MFRLTLSALGRYGFGMHDPAFVVGGLFLLLIPVEYFHLRVARPSPTKAFLIFAITVPTLVAILGTTRGNLLFADPGAEVELATIVGPFVALLVALSGVTLGVFLLAHSSNWTTLPVFGAVLLWAFILAWTDCNDNHPVRLQKDRDRAIGVEKQPLDVVDDERLWIHDDDIPLMLSRWRQDIVGSFRRPIVVVSAEGGGIRAAYFTATALGRIADKCPVIAREMLTVSGVSGGAIGVAAYALAVRTKPISPNDQTCDFSRQGRGYFEDHLSRVFQRDFLTPMIARAAFPDLLQTIIPVPVDAFDRQRGLELALRSSFQREFGRDSFGEAFGQPDRQFTLPFMIVGATSVSGGQQKLFSEFDHPIGRRERQLYFNAASLVATSARFPIISPPGYIYGDLAQNGDGRTVNHKVEYVDGGYYDNSGAFGILQLLQRIRYYRSHSPTFDPQTPILWIRISNSPECIADEKTNRYLAELCERQRRNSQGPNFSFRELGSPLRAIVAARSAKEALTTIAVRQLLDENNELEPSRDIEVRIQMAPIEDEIPLGWYLSRAAANSLSWQLSPKQNPTCTLNRTESSLADCSLERLQFYVSPQSIDPHRIDVNLADWMAGYDGVFEASCRAFSGRQADPRRALEDCLSASIGDSHFPTAECLTTPLHRSGCPIQASPWSRSRREAFRHH
jgi:predicted acylesterase/phospholipase RssA